MWPGGTPHVVVGILKISLDRLITPQVEKKWMNECWEKPQKYKYMSSVLAFFPRLRGPPDVWHYSWIQLSLKYLQLKG